MLGKVILHLNLFSAGIGKVENEMYSKFYYNRFYYLSDTLTLRGITPVSYTHLTLPTIYSV